MTFEDALEAVKGLPGRMVEVAIYWPQADRQVFSLGAFSGVVREVTKSSARGFSDHYYVWFEEDGQPKPNHGHFCLDRETFEGCEVKGSGRSLEDVVEADDDSMGTNWEIVLQHRGVVTEVLIYL